MIFRENCGDLIAAHSPFTQWKGRLSMSSDRETVLGLLRRLPCEERPTRGADKMADRLALLGAKRSHHFVHSDGYPFLLHGRSVMASIEIPWQQGLTALLACRKDALVTHRVIVAKGILETPAPFDLSALGDWTVVRFGHEQIDPRDNAGAVLVALERQAFWLMRELKKAQIVSWTFVVSRGSSLPQLFVTFDTRATKIEVSLDPVPFERCTFMAASPSFAPSSEFP